MIRRLLRDHARPSRISRTKLTLLGGGLTANVLAQAVLVVARMVGYELNVTEAELATVVSVLVGLVAMWYQREATASAQITASEAKYHASEAARRDKPAALGLALAALLLPAAAWAVPVHDGVGEAAERGGATVLLLALALIFVPACALIWSLWRLWRRGSLALAALLLLPSVATAQALKPGAGFELRSGDLVYLAGAGAGCPSTLSVRPEVDPWRQLGVPVTQGQPPVWWPREPCPDAEDPSVCEPNVRKWKQLMCERYGDELHFLEGTWKCKCILRGTRGGWPHHVGWDEDLKDWCEAGLGQPGYDCQPNAREASDTDRVGQDMRARLKAQMCAAGHQDFCRPDCPHGWACDPLSKLPPEQRGRLVRYGPVPGWEGIACTSRGSIWTWVADAPQCWDLPPGCERDPDVELIERYDLPASCWEGGPEPPDPGPTPDPTPCPVCPEPETARARIEVDGCGDYSGKIVTVGGATLPFTPGVRSTGRMELVLVPRPPCPPAPPAPPCPDPEPCEPAPTPDPPPGEPGWEMIHRAPEGWSWTAGDKVPAEIFELRVPIGGSYRGLRVSYEVAVDWSRCRELPGPSPSPKCLGMYITESGRADQVFSYLMAKGSGVVHRHGFVAGWSPSRKPKASSPIRLLDGATYRIEHEVRDGSVTVSVLRDGQGASVLRPPNTCSPAPCFPVSFSGPVVLRAGWRGDEPEEVGGTMGWVLSGLRVEVRRGE